MALKGPIVTLLAGAVFAGVLAAANVNAVNQNTRPYQGAPTPAANASSRPPSPSPTQSPTPAASPSPSTGATVPGGPVVKITRGTFAGHVKAGDGTGASLAIVIRDGVAIAYLCSGRIESWLRGTARDGVLNLTGTHSGTLTGTYGDTSTKGTARTGGKTFPFSMSLVTKPSGLWRSAAEVRGAKILAGWIILPDGSKVGMVDAGGAETEAPDLDPASPVVTVNGSPIAAAQVDGDTGNGF